MNPQEQMAMQLALLGRRHPMTGRPMTAQELLLLRRRYPQATGFTQMPTGRPTAHPMATGYTTLPPLR